jgi:hypothetical protein
MDVVRRSKDQVIMIMIDDNMIVDMKRSKSLATTGRGREGVWTLNSEGMIWRWGRMDLQRTVDIGLVESPF